MAFTNAVKEAAVVANFPNGSATNAWISLHTLDPGTTGTSEATGGSPAYARKQTSWTAGASDGSTVGA